MGICLQPVKRNSLNLLTEIQSGPLFSHVYQNFLSQLCKRGHSFPDGYEIYGTCIQRLSVGFLDITFLSFIPHEKERDEK